MICSFSIRSSRTTYSWKQQILIIFYRMYMFFGNYNFQIIYIECDKKNEFFIFFQQSDSLKKGFNENIKTCINSF